MFYPKQPEFYDLAKGKSAVKRLINMCFDIYLHYPGEANNSDSKYRLGFYGKEVHDKHFSIIKNRHKSSGIFVMGYCMDGTLVLPYLAKRAQERIVEGKDMNVKKVVLMASSFKLDDSKDI